MTVKTTTSDVTRRPPLEMMAVMPTSHTMPATLEDAFALYCKPMSTRPVVPTLLKERLMQISWRIAKQRMLAANGNVGRSTHQLMCYYALARWLAQRRGSSSSSSRNLTACEAGFNIGHSATTYLTGLGPGARYIGFELNRGEKTRAAAQLLNGSNGGGSPFAGALELVYGDSQRAAPAYLAAHPELQCDLLSIDGAHSDAAILADWRILGRALPPDRDHVVTLDDVTVTSAIFLSQRKRPVELRRREAEDVPIRLVGCLKLPGVADDDESLHIFRKAQARGRRNVTSPIVASAGFCVARLARTAPGRAEQPARIVRLRAPDGARDVRMILNVGRDHGLPRSSILASDWPEEEVRRRARR